MRRDMLSPFQKGDRRMFEMDGAILRSLDRFIGQLVQSTWNDLTSTLGIDRNPPGYSGIHPLGASQLKPFLDHPGMFLVFGHLPELRILHLGASQSAIRGPLTSRLIPGPDKRWTWRWESESNPVPTFACCVSLEKNWTLVPALRTLLAQYLAPLSEAYGRHEGNPPFM